MNWIDRVMFAFAAVVILGAMLGAIVAFMRQ